MGADHKDGRLPPAGVLKAPLSGQWSSPARRDEAARRGRIVNASSEGFIRPDAGVMKV